jgi:tetratricopeptide (TPR) repeat protein
MTDRVLSLHPDDSDGLGLALQFPTRRALSTEALNCFQEGLAKLQAAEPAEALNLLCRTVELAPQFPEARICLGLAYALTHNIYPAIDHLEMAGQLDPDSFAAHYTLAQLRFKLRVPQKGYEAAEKALRCVITIEQRKMLADLLKEERARHHNGIERPWFSTPFNRVGLAVAGGGLATAIVALLLYVRW